MDRLISAGYFAINMALVLENIKDYIRNGGTVDERLQEIFRLNKCHLTSDSS